MNPILQSEGFERAAYALRNEFEIAVPRLQQAADTAQAATDSFRDSVDKLTRTLAMFSENMQRAHRDEPMAYVEKDFLS